MKRGSHRPYRRNIGIWLALLALLAVTAGSAYLTMGAWNSIVNLAIAAAKVLLVAFFFMHLRGAGSLIRLAACVAVFMLVILFGVSATDYLNRRMFAAPWQVPQQLHPLGGNRSGDHGQ